EGEEVLVGAAALRGISGEGKSAAQPQVGERHQGISGREISQGQDALKFLSGFGPLAGFQITKSAKIKHWRGALVVRCGHFQYFNRLGAVAGTERGRGLHNWN